MHLKIPLRIESAANLREHWSLKHSRNKCQSESIRYIWQASIQKPVVLPAHITLTRIAPRTLDDDNLIAALKNTRDTIADLLIPNLRPGQADSSEYFSWKYLQKKGNPKEYALEIDIQSTSSEVL